MYRSTQQTTEQQLIINLYATVKTKNAFYIVSPPYGIESMDQHLLHPNNIHDSREPIPEYTQMPTLLLINLGVNSKCLWVFKKSISTESTYFSEYTFIHNKNLRLAGILEPTEAKSIEKSFHSLIRVSFNTQTIFLMLAGLKTNYLCLFECQVETNPQSSTCPQSKETR